MIKNQFNYKNNTFLLLVLLISVTFIKAETPYANPLNFEVWSQFTDEFNSTLSTSKWDVMNKLWTSGTWNVSPDNVSVNGNNLNLTINHNIQTISGSTVYFQSGMIINKTRINEDEYGYFEARIKGTSVHPGSCPAFWLFTRDPATTYPGEVVCYSEVDIVELYQTNANRYQIESNLHYRKRDATGTILTYMAGQNPAQQNHWIASWDSKDDFHTYACDYRPDSIIMYIDGVKVYGAGKENIYWKNQTKLSMVISLGLRPPFEKYDASNNRIAQATTLAEATNAGFPSTMQVDYVRAWKRKNITSLVNTQKEVACIISSTNSVTIKGAIAKKVLIYNTAGQLVFDKILTSDTELIPLEHGVKVVKVADHTPVKVLIK